MPADRRACLIADTEDEMRALGRDLGLTLRGGEVLLLKGPLGAGKTVFVKGLAEGLGVTETVTSPTFTLISVYQGRLPLYHMDFYRLRDPVEAEFLGLEDYFYGGGVSAVEWPEAAADLLPQEALEIRLTLEPGGRRRITFQTAGTAKAADNVEAADTAEAAEAETTVARVSAAAEITEVRVSGGAQALTATPQEDRR